MVPRPFSDVDVTPARPPRSDEPGALAGRRILVTGATGTVGLPVTLSLAATNEVWAVARFTSGPARAALQEAGVRCVAADLALGDLEGVPSEVDHVVNFARPGDSTTAGDFDLAIRGHAESIGLLMGHCAGARSVLHCSSTSMYRRLATASKETDPLTDDRHTGRPTYTLAKLCAEAVVRTAARQWGVPTTIARLNVPYGDHGGWPAQHLDAVVAGRAVTAHPNRPNRFNPIHADDVARTVPALLAAATVPATIVNWAGSDEVALEDWVAYLGELVGRPVEITTSAAATEGITVDTSRLVALAGPNLVGWRDGMRRMVAARYPDLLS